MRLDRAALIGAAAAALAAAGCGAIPPPKSQFPDGDAALGRLHACYECAYGVQGTAKIDHTSPDGRVKGELDFFSVIPDRVRFDAEKFGVMVYTLTSDGKDFKLLDTKQKEFLYGPAKPCNLAKLTKVPLPGHVLVALMIGDAPVLVHDTSTIKLAWDGDLGQYVVNIVSKNDAQQELHLEVHPEDLAKEWKDQRVRLREVKVTQKGTDLYQVSLDDFRSVKTAPRRVDPDGMEEDIPPIGPACDAEIPSTIHMEVPNTLDDVLFKYVEADQKGNPLPKWNPPLPPGVWTQPVPDGVQQIPVDCPTE